MQLLCRKEYSTQFFGRCLAKILLAVIALCLVSCGDFFTPVHSTGEPTEYSYNYWLLDRTYLYQDEIPSLDPDGDSVELMYNKLSDIYTRYIPPSNSEAAETSINTSIVSGDVGMEYAMYAESEHPLFTYRIYPEGPAAKANVPRYGNILAANGIEITGENAYDLYDSILTHNKTIILTILFQGDTATYEMEKEDVYAPTVFVDTVSGIEVIKIKEFKLTTIDRVNGSYGELKAYLDSTQNSDVPRIIDLRGNPGGHVSQCLDMADLFVATGKLSTRSLRTFDGDGKKNVQTTIRYASKGHSGEGKKFILLVNKSSASCAEIFAAAVSEGADIPVAGTFSFGKGIGQTTWKTPKKALAIITNLEFLTPKDNSYNKVGIEPDYPCETSTIDCGLEALEKYYGKKSAKKLLTASSDNALLEIKSHLDNGEVFGGAIIDGSNNY